MDYIYSVVLYPIIYILPAYVANGAPVIFGGGKPVDLGRKLGGRPVLGPHKTIRGLVAGLSAGFIVSMIEAVFFPYMLLIGVLLTIGTHFGDMLGSFIKRRLGHRSGAEFFLLDQYTFFVFAMLFAAPLGNVPTLFGIVFLVAITGMLHKLTNMGAHRLKLKSVAW